MKRYFSPLLLFFTVVIAVLFASRFAHAGGDPISGVVVTLSVWALLHSLASKQTPDTRALLGVSLPIAYSKTKASAVSDTPLTEQQLWTKTLFLNEGEMYEENPFGDNMTFGTEDPKQADGAGKAIMEVVETRKVHGTKVNIPLMSGLGGEPVFGDGVRSGSGMTYTFGNFQISVGRSYFETGWTVTAESETMQGGNLAVRSNIDLAKVMARKRCNDILINLRKAAYTANGAPNLMLPLGRSTEDDITTADTLNVTLVNAAAEVLPGNGAEPMNTAREPQGSRKLNFMGLIQNIAMSNLSIDPLYRNQNQNGDVRGEYNANFTGVVMPINGTLLYRWNNKDHKNKDAIGNPLMCRAKLGAAITGAGNATVVQGGGLAYNAGDITANANSGLYFKLFPNAPYLCWNGDLFTADTTTTRYVAIVNPNGTFGVFPYILNDGHTLTLSGAALAVGPSGKRTTTFVVGARIYLCNALGTYLAYSLFYGQNMMGSGVGSLDGGEGLGAQLVNKETGKDDHGSRKYIGSEAVWGCRPVNDWQNTYPNFLLVQHAILPANAPALN